MAENELLEAVVEEARVAALVALARHGPSHDVQAFLVRGDDRGTFPPGALEVMVRAALTAAGVTEMREALEDIARDRHGVTLHQAAALSIERRDIARTALQGSSHE